MTGQSVFSRQILAILISLAVALFALSLYLMSGPQTMSPGGDAVGPGVFSRSALGHAGLAGILDRLGVPVVKSRYASLGKLGEDSVLVVAEPAEGIDILRGVAELLKADSVLLVLPKRQGVASQKHPGWIADWQFVGEQQIQLLLDLLDVDAEVRRVDSAGAWVSNALGVDPQIGSPVQLLRSKELRPLVAGEAGILLGELRRGKRSIFILADPDVIENHGLRQSANAAFAVTLFERLRRSRGSVVFDESVHGYVSEAASPLKLLFTFPYVLVTLQGALALGLLLWATMGRFGKAEPIPSLLDAGKLGLIAGAARLIAAAGHHEVTLRRYVMEALRDTARQLHAPAGQSDAEQAAWLARVGAARGAEVDCAALLKRLAEAPAKGSGDAVRQMSIAYDTFRWRRGIIDGHSANPGRHRRDPPRDP